MSNNVTTYEDDWERFEKEHSSPAEREELSLRSDIYGEFIRMRDERKMTQKKLAEFLNIKQPVLSRVLNGDSDPRLSTLMKILVPMGKTLSIVPYVED